MMDMEAYDKLPKTVRRRLQDALGNRDPHTIRQWKASGMKATQVVKQIEAWDRADNAGAARAGAMPKVEGPFQLVPRKGAGRQRRYLP